MSVKFLSAIYGEAATEALDEAISFAQSASPLDPVTIVTPTSRSAVRLRHEIVRRRATTGGRAVLANARFVVLARLADLLGAAPLRAQGLRRVSRADIGAALHAEIAAQPSWLAEALSHPAGESELVDRYEELRAAHPDALRRLAAGGGRAREVARLIAAVHERLAPRCYDDVDLFRSATAVVRERPEMVAGVVIVHLPAQLHHSEIGLLRALGEGGDLLVVTGQQADSQRPLMAARTLEELGAMPEIGESAWAPVAFDEVLVAADPASEVREVVRLALQRLGEGLSPERIALCYSRAEPYAPLLASELERAGLPLSGRAPERLDHAPSARFLLQLLAISRHAMSRSALIGLLEAAPVREDSGRRAPRAEWDRCSRLAGAVEGDLAHWTAKLAALAATARSRLAPPQEDGAAPLLSRLVSRSRRSLDAAEGCTAFVRALDAQLGALERASSWREAADGCAAALERFCGPEAERANWPGWAGTADALVLSTLEELAALDEFATPVALARFREALALAFSRPGPNVGHLAGGLVVGTLEQASAIDLDLVVVLGASDRELPAAPLASPLLSSTDRARAGLEARSALAGFARDRVRLSAAVAGGAQRLASYASGALGGALRGQSPLVSAAATRHLDSRLSAAAARAVSPALALDESELVAGALLASPRHGPSLLGDPLVANDVLLSRGLALVFGRGSRALSPYGGALSVRGIADHLAGVPFSPTSLEEYANCPARYLYSHLLALEVVEDPERRLFIDPRDRGSIVHEVLERYVAELMAAGEDWDDEAGAARLAAIAGEVFARYERRGLTGKRVLWELERRRLLRLVEFERRADTVRRRGGVRPIALEHPFGFAEVEAVQVSAGGRTLSFRGMIDRVDATPRGVRVVDYKTGRPDGFRPIAKDPVDKGRHLQLVVYGLAARAAFAKDETPITAAYRFLGGVPEDVAIELTDQNVARFAEATDVLVSSIDSGAFPVNPGEASYDGFENCRFCDFDDLCPSDREQRWEQARSTPLLARYRTLIEGEAVDDAAVDLTAGAS